MRLRMRMTAAALSLIMVFFLAGCMSYFTNNTRRLSITDDGYVYAEKDTHFNSGTLDIPEKLSGKTVVGIKSNAFSSSKGLSGAVVTIPDTVKVIGSNAFYNTGAVFEELDLTSVMKVGSSAFYGCSVETMYINDNVKDYSASTSWTNGMKSVERIVFEDGTTTCYDFLTDNVASTVTSVALPSSVTTINNYAFYCCSKLKNITLPSSVTKIGSYAFNASSLVFEELDLSSVSYVGSGAFDGCSVRKLTVGPDLSEYNTNWADNMKGVKTLVVADSVTAVTSFLSKSMKESLENVVLPDGIETIGDCVFEDCSRLKTVTFPFSITKIGRNAFKGTGLELQELDITQVDYVGASAFDGCTVNTLFVDSSISGYSSSWNDNMTVKTVYVPDSVSNYTSWFSRSILRQKS